MKTEKRPEQNPPAELSEDELDQVTGGIDPDPGEITPTKLSNPYVLYWCGNTQYFEKITPPRISIGVPGNCCYNCVHCTGDQFCKKGQDNTVESKRI